MTENIEVQSTEEINLKDFKDGADANHNNEKNDELIDILCTALNLGHYNETVSLTKFQKNILNSKFEDSFGFEVSWIENRPSLSKPAHKDYILKQHNKKEEFDKTKHNYIMLNKWDASQNPKEPGEPRQRPWGGYGENTAKLFEYLYASDYKLFDENNIFLLEQITTPSLEEKIKKENVKLEGEEIGPFRRHLDPIVLLNDWLPAQVEKDKTELPVFQFDYDKFFENVFEGMKKLYSLNDNEKNYAKEAAEKLRQIYFNKNFDTLIHFGYPRRNRAHSLINPSSVCSGPRALNLGCFYCDPLVFNMMKEPETTIGHSIDILIDKRNECRGFLLLQSYMPEWKKEHIKEILENCTYFGGIMANFYAAGKYNLSEDGKIEYRTAVEKQISRLEHEKQSSEITKDLSTLIKVHKK